MRKTIQYLLANFPLVCLLAVVALYIEQPPANASEPETSATYNDSAPPKTLKDAGIASTEILTQTPSESSPELPTFPTPAAATPSAFPRIPEQINGTFTSGSGSGYEPSFLGIDGFVPLAQTPGKDLAYLQGRLLLSTEGKTGGNVVVGYRRFNPAQNSILGGYVGFDVRDTGRATFSQLGAGVEGIWSGFEVRLNGYLPVGSTRQTVDSQNFSSSTSTTTTNRSSTPTGAFRFQGNNLLFDIAQTTNTTVITNTTQFNRSRDEVALGGFDLEAGLKLLQWKPDGDLRSYLGLYHYSGSNINGFVGVRGRLVARINQYASVGLSVQSDREFGTTAAVTVGLTFPGMSRVHTSESTSNWVRMGDSVSRSNIVAITERTRTSSFGMTTSASTSNITTSAEAALNPTTGEPYVFEHVVLGNAAGNGTFENPFGTVAAALTAVPGDGNGIVYVQPGTNPGIPAFTVKDNVQVLSTGPVQTLATVQLGTVQLPLSGAGTLPSVTNTVTMGNNTVLSGFAVTPPTGNTPIVANGVQNVTIRDNQVQATGNDTPGIRLQNVSGTAIATNNTVSTAGATVVFPTGAFGIFADISNTTLPNLILTNNTITTSGSAGHGVSVTTRNTGAIANATVTNNTIKTTATSGLGILVLSLNTSLIDTVTLANNTINTGNTFAYGVSVNPRDTSSIKTAIVSDNTITTTGGDAYGIIVNPRNSGSITTMTTSRNTISTSGANSFGIHVIPINSGVITTMTASDNRISTSGVGASGIYVIPQNTSAIADLSISNNTITTAANNARGIFLDINQPATNPLQVRIANNTLPQTGFWGIQLNSAGNSQTSATIANNTISNAVGIGILAISLNNSRLRTLIDNNQIFNVINASGLQLGLSVEAGGTSQLFASVTNNRVTNPNPFVASDLVEFKAQVGVFGGSTTASGCVRFSNNTASNSGYLLRKNLATTALQLEPFTANAGTRQADIGVITNVAAGTCGF
ncbi:MAG: inverse autotransporter beta domain-containing protein [Oscillatoriales cyanobacterium C42_A2020_001]|nr:inverse autotransporter beta domain-containing protein [Leptolyngbyaceae cyanobacterium C42_A2020_001]